MENLKFSVFDVFAYLLPGTVIILAAIILLSPTIVSLTDLALAFEDINLSQGIVALIIAYIAGNVIDNPGSWFHYRVGCRIWGQPYPKNRHPKLSHAQQRALVRHYSPENFSALQTWKVLKTMSHNLSFAFLIILAVSSIRLVQNQTIDWLFIVIISFVFVIVLLNRAQIYDSWHYKQLIETVEVLNLERRSSEDADSNIQNDLLLKSKMELWRVHGPYADSINIKMI